MVIQFLPIADRECRDTIRALNGTLVDRPGIGDRPVCPRRRGGLGSEHGQRLDPETAGVLGHHPNSDVTVVQRGILLLEAHTVWHLTTEPNLWVSEPFLVTVT